MRTSRWALLAYILVTLFGIAAALPNVLPASLQQTVGRYLPHPPSRSVSTCAAARISFWKSMPPAFARRASTR